MTRGTGVSLASDASGAGAIAAGHVEGSSVLVSS